MMGRHNVIMARTYEIEANEIFLVRRQNTAETGVPVQR